MTKNKAADSSQLRVGMNKGLSASIFQPEHQLQPRPHIVHGAYFDVRQAVLQGDFAHYVFIYVGLDFGSAFGPGDPQAAVHGQVFLELSEAGFKNRFVSSKELNEVTRALQGPQNRDIFWQRAQGLVVTVRRIAEIDSLSILYSEFFNQRSLGIAGHKEAISKWQLAISKVKSKPNGKSKPKAAAKRKSIYRKGRKGAQRTETESKNKEQTH